MMLFHIRNAIFSLFRNGFIKSLEYQSAIKLKPKSEESITERTSQRLDEIGKKEKTIDLNLFDQYFKYSSPSDTYKKLNQVDTENYKVKVNFTKDNFKKDIENVSKDEVDKIEEMNEMADIAELILYFNNKDQRGEGLKILTPNQMLSRLPISLAELNAGNKL